MKDRKRKRIARDGSPGRSDGKKYRCRYDSKRRDPLMQAFSIFKAGWASCLRYANEIRALDDDAREILREILRAWSSERAA